MSDFSQWSKAKNVQQIEEALYSAIVEGEELTRKRDQMKEDLRRAEAHLESQREATTRLGEELSMATSLRRSFITDAAKHNRRFPFAEEDGLSEPVAISDTFKQTFCGQ